MTGSYKSVYRRHVQAFHPQLLCGIEQAKKRAKRKRNNKSHKYDDVRKCLLELVTIHGRPLAVVNDPPMMKILSWAIGVEKCPFNAKQLKDDIEAIGNEVKAEIIAETRGKLISMMLDIVTKFGRSVLGVNIQYIVTNSKGEDALVVRSIGMLHMEQSHTGIYIADLVVQLLNEYDIDIKNVYVVKSITDLQKMIQRLIHSPDCSEEPEEVDIDDDDFSAEIMSNVDYNHLTQVLEDDDIPESVAGTMNGICSLISPDEISFETIKSLLEGIHNDVANINENIQYIEGMFCTAHTLQLAITDAFKKWEDESGLLMKSHAIILKLRTPSFRKIIKSQNLALPILNNQTRWNSMYLMVGFALKNYTHPFISPSENIHNAC